jgi:pilus assembly protein CpaE
MNEINQDIMGAATVDLDILDGCQVPRVSIVAFCETQAAADMIANASADRRMSRASIDVRVGGIARAIEFYRDSPSPDLLILESRASSADLLGDIEGLADVCDPDTRVVVIGASNDVMLYRELTDRGIADYLVWPVSEPAVIAAVGRVFRDAKPKQLGKTLAFIGAKGGVGASTVAHNVAWTLAGKFASNVILADMDLPFGTAGLDFNIDAEQGIADAIGDSSRLDALLLDRLLVSCGDHLSLLAAPAVLGKAYDFDETAFEQMLDIARAHAPNVVLDVPHMWTAWSRRTLISADEVVIVAEPDLANLRNAKSLVELLIQARPNDTPPKLVLNRVGMPRRPEIEPAEFAAALNLEPIAIIAFDPATFGTAANKGQMIASVSARSPACGAFGDIAQAVAGRNDAKARPKRGLAVRLSGLLGLGRQRARPAAVQSGARP